VFLPICFFLKAIVDSDAKDGERVDVYMEMEDEMFVLASLRPPYRDQTPLDLHFEAGDDIALLVRGTSGVSLTGYYVETDLEDHYYLSDEEEAGEEVCLC
jgi:Nucleoplasmin-like domain